MNRTFGFGGFVVFMSSMPLMGCGVMQLQSVDYPVARTRQVVDTEQVQEQLKTPRLKVDDIHVEGSTLTAQLTMVAECTKAHVEQHEVVQYTETRWVGEDGELSSPVVYGVIELLAGVVSGVAAAAGPEEPEVRTAGYLLGAGIGLMGIIDIAAGASTTRKETRWQDTQRAALGDAYPCQVTPVVKTPGRVITKTTPLAFVTDDRGKLRLALPKGQGPIVRIELADGRQVPWPIGTSRRAFAPSSRMFKLRSNGRQPSDVS